MHHQTADAIISAERTSPTPTHSVGLREAVAAFEQATTPHDVETARDVLLFVVALGCSVPEARAFLEADAYHREGVRLDTGAWGIAYRQHQMLQRMVAIHDARRRRRSAA